MVEGKVIARYIPNSWKCPVNLDVNGDLLHIQMFNSSKSNIFQLKHRMWIPLMHNTLPYACHWTQIHQNELLKSYLGSCVWTFHSDLVIVRIVNKMEVESRARQNTDQSEELFWPSQFNRTWMRKSHKNTAHPKSKNPTACFYIERGNSLSSFLWTNLGGWKDCTLNWKNCPNVKAKWYNTKGLQ